MVIVKCEKCGKEYQLGPNDKISDFKCECGGKLSLKKNEPTNGTKFEGVDLKQLFVYQKKASRIELFVRIFYAIPVGIILFFYGIIASLCVAVQWIIILILGRRSEGLSDFIKGYLEYYVHLMSYFSYMTDKRPGITPQDNKIYEVIEEE